ncbi:MAG: inositol monophosphatase family protein [Clostridia bacterium]
MEIEKLMRICGDTAREAGDYARAQGAPEITVKGLHDYVTQADRATERLIRERLLRAYPGTGFYGEETGVSEGKLGEWVVDPIDGTTNYMRGLPIYTTSIAFRRDGELLAGAVYCPALGELFLAGKHLGATLNGEKIHVSREGDLQRSLVGMSFAHQSNADGARMKKLIPLLRDNVDDMRRMGSAAYALSCVACGRYEAFLELGLKPYDIAAGVLLVTEAGGIVTGWPGEQDAFEKGNILSGNAQVNAPLSALLKQV